MQQDGVTEHWLIPVLDLVRRNGETGAAIPAVGVALV